MTLSEIQQSTVHIPQREDKLFKQLRGLFREILSLFTYVWVKLASLGGKGVSSFAI
jgi:hypothetical protein